MPNQPQASIEKVCVGCGLNFTPHKFVRHRQKYCSIQCQSKYHHLHYYKNHRREHKSYYLKRVYGLSLDDVNSLIEVQNSSCAICNISFDCLTPKNIHIDHCHETGKVRGILCNNCNFALGLLKDNAETFETAAAYLRYHGK